MNTSFIINLLLLGVIASCGGGGGGGNDKAQRQEENAAVEAGDGVYHAHLRPMNPRSSGFLPHGGATVRVDGDKLTIKTYLDDDSSVTHIQSIHTGTSCPNSSHDRNGDGFIDYKEALRALGPVLIPLDGDLSAQDAGKGVYPKGSGFTYTRTASISEMLRDLWERDPVPGDEFTKLRPDEGMRLVGRVVLIHGTYAGSHLPATLSGRGDEAPHLSLPVVCGVISPVP